MAMKQTVEQMKHLMHGMQHDLEKAISGNRAAAKRVRTTSVKFSKIAKTYRKESVAELKKNLKTELKKKLIAKKKKRK